MIQVPLEKLCESPVDSRDDQPAALLVNAAIQTKGPQTSESATYNSAPSDDQQTIQTLNPTALLDGRLSCALSFASFGSSYPPSPVKGVDGASTALPTFTSAKVQTLSPTEQKVKSPEHVDDGPSFPTSLVDQERPQSLDPSSHDRSNIEPASRVCGNTTAAFSKLDAPSAVGSTPFESWAVDLLKSDDSAARESQPPGLTHVRDQIVPRITDCVNLTVSLFSLPRISLIRSFI